MSEIYLNRSDSIAQSDQEYSQDALSAYRVHTHYGIVAFMTCGTILCDTGNWVKKHPNAFNYTTLEWGRRRRRRFEHRHFRRMRKRRTGLNLKVRGGIDGRRHRQALSRVSYADTHRNRCWCDSAGRKHVRRYDLLYGSGISV
jgi:hypothetical protein